LMMGFCIPVHITILIPVGMQHVQEWQNDCCQYINLIPTCTGLEWCELLPIAEAFAVWSNLYSIGHLPAVQDPGSRTNH
jgi:hypothetical protein